MTCASPSCTPVVVAEAERVPELVGHDVLAVVRAQAEHVGVEPHLAAGRDRGSGSSPVVVCTLPQPIHGDAEHGDADVTTTRISPGAGSSTSSVTPGRTRMSPPVASSTSAAASSTSGRTDSTPLESTNRMS